MYTRRSYKVTSSPSDPKGDLNRSKIELAVLIDGKVHSRVEAKKNSLCAVLVRDGSFDIEIVEPQARVVDNGGASAPLPWQVSALSGS